MTLLELVAEYGPIVFADPETGVVIQRNGSYLNWAVEGRDGWSHADCRNVDRDAYVCTLSEAMDSAQEWFREVMEGESADETDDE